MNKNILIPADVPSTMHATYLQNYNTLTKGTHHLALFAGDQKIEHLNKDFYGPSIDESALNPEHLFRIAAQGAMGAFATQLGLIARFGTQYPAINYIVKLNAKTDIIPPQERDPLSTALWQVDDIVALKKNSNLSICGIGYTVYLGSQHENIMLAQAAQAVFQAHQHGLLAIIWLYPRGKYVTNEKDPKLIAGAAGVATCLGADFAKINMPMVNDQPAFDQLAIAAQAAGNTKIMCSGGKLVEPELFLKTVHAQLHAGAAGSAAGRNIYQRSLPTALAMTQAIAALVYNAASYEQALEIFQTKK